MTQYDYTVITDIGSTTTKAIVIDCSQRKLLALEHADTTVEAPYNDVKIGIINAIKSIERQSGISLITDIKPDNSFSPAPGVRYLSTSSAGGGLQI
ncbi:MAG: glutamate mutase L, partial [Candidatus Cloacimonetes bacterium]|nr:glutamate mutase L [Candidatus Cloacimonadota bacterium]